MRLNESTGLKRCVRCKQDKKAEEYSKCKMLLDGLQASCKVCNQKYYNTNHKVRDNYHQKYVLNHKETIQKQQQEYHQSYKLSPLQVLNNRMRTLVNDSMKNKLTTSWTKAVGYTLEALKLRIESQFLPGMTWDAISEFEMDHTIPVSAFNFTSAKDDDFKRCWSLSNLCPATHKQNMKKGSKIIFCPDNYLYEGVA